MKFTETKLKGAFIIELEQREDERGFFARTFCQREYEAHGLNPHVAQCSMSFNKQKGTLRGIHYQAPPHAEAKTVCCVRGAIYDVMVDLRRESPTFKQWVGVELSAAGREMVYVPEGFGHGFQTLDDGCEVHYQMSEFYDAEAARGVRWNDPAFGIVWPIAEGVVISERDAHYPDYPC